MSLSDVIRNIAKTVTNKDELKEKAKDLPLLVAQTALSAAGQAMLLVDRVKNSIRGQGEKEEQDSRPAADQLAAPAEQDEDKPARKEPVIFAPRPGSAEPNGTGKPDPVIFAPAGKTEPATPTGETAEAKPAQAPVAPAKPETAEPATAGKPDAAAEPSTAGEKDVVEEPATADEPGPAEKPAAAAKPRATRVEPKADDKPAARKPATRKSTARKSTAKEPAASTEPPAAAAPAAASEPGAAAATDLPEPLPGYAELTVASLRARMRGKTAEQIGDFLAYERATKGRAEVIRMFENRLAKLQAGE
ncbi:hypothetical protein E1267_01790 [Nonomuraea longispora]|uniref:DUF8129 domain-containing protein n=1 Tax=Nonomuraea longispora TaxID=1848320 RepID=A0A4R4NV12_9ACTN|nr:hypothetical protein [Nonomuraea longispora]TDC11182.1 hypothetical protein E1267_01790 [Nonomuraea longispora]